MTRRKVLWFINKVPLAVARTTGTPGVRGGWLDSYIGIVGDEADTDLTVAFPDESGRVSGISIDGVAYVGLPSWEPASRLGRVITRWRHDAAPPEVLTAVTRLVRDVDPDLIHLHGAEYCFGLAVRGCGVPTVLSIQGSPTVIRRLYLRGADRYYLRSLSFADFLKGRGPFHYHMRMKAQATNEAVTMASVGHIAGRTEWDRRLASVMAPQAVYHRCEEPMRLPFHEASWNADAACPARIVSTSGHYALKGVGTLLRAVGIVRRTVPEVTLVLAGVLADEEHERATMRHIHALGIEDHVTLLGEATAQTIAKELSRANVFVIASHIENSSNALSEAQLVGVPCVASSAGGLVTLADHGDAALLFQDGDAEALAGALLSLFGDPDEAARLGARGRALAIARHDREHIRTQILSIYDEMLS
jgi:glycosyltransferase involved in cell wall biosynthesis